MTELCYTLGGKPCPWQRARSSGPARYTPARMRQTQRAHKEAAAVAIMLTRGRWQVPEPKGCTYEVEVTAYEHPTQRGDADNYGKAVVDALQGMAYRNDRSVTDVTFRRRADREKPRTEVVVRRLGSGAGAEREPAREQHGRSQGVKPPGSRTQEST